MGTEPTPVVDCTKCGDELNAKKRPLCQGCVDDACADVVVDCNICGTKQADKCDDCAGNATAGAAFEYAQRRKMLGLMSPEVFAAFGEFIDELEGR